jgi:hypothetical protein
MLKNYRLNLLALMLLLSAPLALHAQTGLRKNPGFKLRSGTQNRLIPIKKSLISAGKNRNSAGFAKAPGDTLFYENFEGTTWPDNLQRLNVDGRPAAASINTLFGTNAWTLRPEGAGITNQVGASTSWTNPVGVANRWMVSPEVTLTGDYKLSWLSKAVDPDFPDGYEVRICTNCPANITNANVLSSFSTVLFSLAEDQTEGLLPHSVSLSAYEGQTVRFAFRNNSDDKFILMIDDILLYRVPQKDLAAGEIFSPSNEIYNCSRENFPVAISYSNPGAATVQNVLLRVISSGPVNDTVSLAIDSIQSEQTDTIVFTEGLNLSTIGSYNLRLEVIADGDEIPGNNASLSSYEHEAPAGTPFFTDFNELFIDSVLPSGWFCSSRFLPFSSSGTNGSNSIELPVFNVLGAQAPQTLCVLNTSKYNGIQSGNQLMFKYKITDLNGLEQTLADGDTILVKILKNCNLAGSYSINTSSHESNSLYRKLFLPLDSYGFTSADQLSVEISAKIGSLTDLYLFEMDDFTIGTPAANDISLVDLERFPFSIVKKYQLGELQFKGSVSNESQNVLSPVRIEALVTPTNQLDTARISTLGEGLVRTFTTSPGVNFADAGLYNINLSASSPGVTDPNPDDNTVQIDLDVSDSIMAKDFGDPLDFAYLQYGAGSGGKRIMANAIKTTKIDTMTSVSVYVGPIAEDCQAKAFFASRNATTGAWTEDSSAVIVDIPVDLADSWVPLRFSKNQAATRRGKPVAANSENLYGVKIRGGNLLVGFNFENASDDGSFIWLGTSFLGTQDITLGSLNGPFSIFIRANFGRISTLITGMSQVEQSLLHSEIAPNPSQGNAQLIYAGKEGGMVDIQVMNLSGQLVGYQSYPAFKGVNRFDIPSKGIQKGIYLVKVSSNGFTSTKKMVID